MGTNRSRLAAAAAAAAAVLAAAPLGGCAAFHAGAPPPEIERARAVIQAADDEGAAVEPSAHVHLALARATLDRAARCLARGDRDGAAGLARRAEADAAVALLAAREATLRDAASRTLDHAALLAEQAARIDLDARRAR